MTQPNSALASFTTQKEFDLDICARTALVQELHADLLSLKAHRNEVSTPIMRLSNDVLAEVFTCFASLCHVPRYQEGFMTNDQVFKLLYITHVCRRWRTLALALPRLWYRAPMTSHVDCLQAFLKRSRDLPLSIIPGPFGFMCEINRRVMLALYPVACRIQHISLSVTIPLLHALDNWKLHGLSDATRHMPMLETLELELGDETDDLPPESFWFLSAGDLPQMHTLKLYYFGVPFARTLVRSTLTRLYLQPKWRASYRDWIDLLQQTPMLEDLELVWIRGTADVNQSVSLTERIPLHHLCRLQLSEEGSGVLSASILNHLETPSDCDVSIEVDNKSKHQSSAVYSFILSNLSSMLNGAGSIGVAQQVYDMSLSISSGLRLVLQTRDRGGWNTQKTVYDSDEEASTGCVIELSFEECVPSHVIQALQSGVLPLSELALLELNTSAYSIDAALEAFERCTKLQVLSLSSGYGRSGHDYRPLLEKLSHAQSLFPALYSLSLNLPQWHIHHSRCDPPYSDEPLSAALDRLLDARRATGVPIGEVVLQDLVHVDCGKDLPWLEAMVAGTSPRFLWTEQVLQNPFVDKCSLCGAIEERSRSS